MSISWQPAPTVVCLLAVLTAMLRSSVRSTTTPFAIVEYPA